MNNLPGNPFGFGFVYFNNSANNTSSPNGSTSNNSNDYLEFSNTDSPGHFSPSNSSSPNQFRHRNFRGNRHNKMHNRNRYSNSYNNSNSYNSNNRNSSNFRNQNNKKYNTEDITQYYHPSMVEDPWFELERSLNKEEQVEKTDQDTSNNDLNDSVTEIN